ncbi:hypothetical protein EDC04DRAFT_2868313 [Pisolithus marmoratus]|nr:hypothetical protein EDC04DRAFT_2868313 [Pisolithus marmoratus]
MPGVPAFPDNVPIHSLPTIDFELLKEGSQAEIDRLWEAAITHSFWYIKNHGAEQEVQAMFDLGAKTFGLPLEEKLKYEQGDTGRSFGYKKIGGNAPDMTEFLNIAKDDVLAFPQVVHRTYPPMVTAAIPSILGLPEGTLEELHARGLPSGSEPRIIRSPPMPGKDTANRPVIGAHTDFGSLVRDLLTLRFCTTFLGGLQVLLPGETQWRYVKPIPGHAICDIGDALAVFSGGILKSSIHRVVPPPGAQGEHERWSLVFFTRPNNTQVLRALVEDNPLIAESIKQYPQGKFETGFTAAEWYARRTKYQRLGNRAGPQSWAASRGTEHDPAAR